MELDYLLFETMVTLLRDTTNIKILKRINFFIFNDFDLSKLIRNMTFY